MITRVLCSLSMLLFLVTANASDNIKLSIGQWSFEDLQATNLQFDINLTAKGLALYAQADSVQLAAPIGKITKLSVQCDELILLTETFSCTSGKLSFYQAELGRQKIAFKIDAEPEKDKYKINLQGVSLASANFAATVFLNKKN